MNNSKLSSGKAKRYFPCQYCKGSGIAEEGERVDGIQVSADWDCGNCEGQGLIEIGGKIHMRNKIYNLGIKHLEENKDYTYNEVMKIGRKYL